MIKYLSIVLLIFLVSDIIGIKTKALLSGPFVTLATFVILFQFEVIPTDIIERAGLSDLAPLSLYLIMVDMGTMMDIKVLKREWRTVVMAALSVVFAAVGILCVMPFIGRAEALVAIPIINGSLQAAVLVTDAALEKGLMTAYALGIILYAMQRLVGTLVASSCGRMEAQHLLKAFRQNDYHLSEIEETTEKPAFWQRYQKYYTNATNLAILAILGFVAHLLQIATGLNNSIFCLALGFIARNIGLLPEKPLTMAKTSGLLHVVCFTNLVPALSDISFADIWSLALPLVLVFAATFLALIVFVLIIPSWKIVGSRPLAIGICMGQLLAFPTTMLVSNEIIASFSESKEERDFLEQKILIPFVLSGLVSASTLSVVVSAIVVYIL